MLFVNKGIGIIGFGNQARSWAQNLRDSSWEVTVLLRERSPSIKEAKALNFTIKSLEAIPEFSILAVLIPDEEIPKFHKAHETAFTKNQNLIFAHGYSLHFKTADWSKYQKYFLVAPKAIGFELREKYLSQEGVPVFISEEKGESSRGSLNLVDFSKDLGGVGSYIHPVCIRDEVISNLFSEQVLLCGGVPALLAKSFEQLVSNDVDEKVAYFQTIYELEVLLRMYKEKGFLNTYKGISPTALFGAQKAASVLVDQQLKQKMNHLLEDIESGVFTQELNQEHKEGQKKSKQFLNSMKTEAIQVTGEKLRKEIYG